MIELILIVAVAALFALFFAEREHVRSGVSESLSRLDKRITDMGSTCHTFQGMDKDGTVYPMAIWCDGNTWASFIRNRDAELEYLNVDGKTLVSYHGAPVIIHSDRVPHIVSFIVPMPTNWDTWRWAWEPFQVELPSTEDK